MGTIFVGGEPPFEGAHPGLGLESADPTADDEEREEDHPPGR